MSPQFEDCCKEDLEVDDFGGRVDVDIGEDLDIEKEDVDIEEDIII